jgi:hypothetical protein
VREYLAGLIEDSPLKDTTAQAEDPLDGAVDIVNQARYAQDQSGPCAECSVPGNSDHNLPPPEERVEEP